jgi:uncharacterized membrane protein
VKRPWVPIGSLLILSGLALALLAARVLKTQELRYTFLAWNLFLAWIPVGLSVAAERLALRASPRPGLVGMVLVAWLLFFPNAPYLTSDLIHLRYATGPLWYDLCLLSCFAWCGLVLGLCSLETVHRLMSLVHAKVGWVCVAAVCGLSGFGTYLGRFLRYNSWDAALRPGALAADVLARFASPLEYPRTWGVTITFGTLLLVSYLALHFARNSRGRVATDPVHVNRLPPQASRT